MRLPPPDTERFYRIWFALLANVNEQLHLVRRFPAQPAIGSVEPEVAIKIRDAMWANDAVREHFIADNPAHLSVDDLALVSSWQHRVAGPFVLLRSLAKYTIFLSQSTPVHAYGVLGLVSPIEETLPLPLPLYVEAVLLPFEGRIIYDGLLTSYPVVLGSGIRRDLQELYRNLQEREGVITSLGLEEQAANSATQLQAILARNRKVLNAFRRDRSQSGLSPQTVERHVSAIAEFAQTMLLAGDPPRGLLELTQSDLQSALQGADPALFISFKRLIRFLINTGRIDYEEGFKLQDWLKRARPGKDH
jgi:hypothetical protein